MSKTLEEIAKMDPNDVVYAARRELRTSPKLRQELAGYWTTFMLDLSLAVGAAADQGFQMPAWMVKEKMDKARVAMLVAILMGHPQEALDAARRAAEMVLLGEDGQPL